ncbi:Ribonuclease H [Rippkaea orientalis PCC 8801]|uniref:Ribonuclease HII n=1 Tax=Rippkaea orientalis (strain PCC 8801 / RF-1) TaxID=41431 RepID=B7K0Z9_RIPO1|nr:ribonuclease HII [Rippkaea orientalis]ACK65140.1 Ribonuclease H [Rippkaea orientalis PCC 8801]
MSTELDLLDPETLIAGVDEVGRGTLFGPVVAAVVVIPVSSTTYLQEIGVKDSKQLSAKKRLKLAQEIKIVAKGYHISYASVKEIDRLNILQASLLAMKRAVLHLSVEPAICLVDGRQKIPDLTIPQQTIIGGDRLSPIIAAASILAKVWRDELIIRLDAKYPQYDLANNKGYGTLKHRLALEKYGVSPQHRLSFRPCYLNLPKKN